MVLIVVVVVVGVLGAGWIRVVVVCVCAAGWVVVGVSCAWGKFGSGASKLELCDGEGLFFSVGWLPLPRLRATPGS